MFSLTPIQNRVFNWTSNWSDILTFVKATVADQRRAQKIQFLVFQADHTRQHQEYSIKSQRKNEREYTKGIPTGVIPMLASH